MNRRELDKFVKEMAAQWEGHEPDVERRLSDLVMEYEMLESKDFLTGLFVGMLLPLEKFKTLEKQFDEATRALWFSTMKYLAHKIENLPS